MVLEHFVSFDRRGYIYTALLQNFTLEWAARAGCSDSSDMLSCIRGLSASELMDVEIEQVRCVARA